MMCTDVFHAGRTHHHTTRTSSFNLQFVVVDRWAPERVKGLKERDAQYKENELRGLRQLGNASTRK